MISIVKIFSGFLLAVTNKGREIKPTAVDKWQISTVAKIKELLHDKTNGTSD
jgi:hypothetical protein